MEEQEQSRIESWDRRPRRLPFATTAEDYEAIMAELSAINEQYR